MPEAADPSYSLKALSAFLALTRASDLMTVRLTSKCDNQRLTFSQFGVLEALLAGGALCQKELGEKIFKSSGNITMVIDNLEKRELVRRERKGNDRRFVTIHLTDEGNKVINEVLPKLASFIRDEMKVLTEEEQESLHKMCKKLATLKENA